LSLISEFKIKKHLNLDDFETHNFYEIEVKPGYGPKLGFQDVLQSRIVLMLMAPGKHFGAALDPAPTLLYKLTFFFLSKR
jgi:hypothetical protein